MTPEAPETIERATLRANGLLVREMTEPPFEAMLDFADAYIELDDLPTNLFIQHELVDFLGQRTLESSNVGVHSRFLWTFPTLGESWAGPQATPEGHVVFGNTNAVFYALDSSGVEAWHVDTDDEVRVGAAVDETGRVFFGTVGGTVYARNSSGGNLWTRDISSPPGGELVTLNDHVYVGGFSGTVFALRSSDGGVAWSYTVPGQISASVAVEADGTVTVGSQDRSVYSIRDGVLLWSAETGGEVWGAAALGENRVYIGSNDGWVYAYDQLGNELWTSEVEGQVWGRALLSSDGALYVGSTARFLNRIDPETGDILWRTRTEGISTAAPVEGPDGLIYVGSTVGTLYAIEPEAGEVMWTIDAGDAIHGTPLVVGDRVYLGSTSRDLVAVQRVPPGSE